MTDSEQVVIQDDEYSIAKTSGDLNDPDTPLVLIKDCPEHSRDSDFANYPHHRHTTDQRETSDQREKEHNLQHALDNHQTSERTTLTETSSTETRPDDPMAEHCGTTSRDGSSKETAIDLLTPVSTPVIIDSLYDRHRHSLITTESLASLRWDGAPTASEKQWSDSYHEHSPKVFKRPSDINERYKPTDSTPPSVQHKRPAAITPQPSPSPSLPPVADAPRVKSALRGASVRTAGGAFSIPMVGDGESEPSQSPQVSSTVKKEPLSSSMQYYYRAKDAAKDTTRVVTRAPEKQPSRIEHTIPDEHQYEQRPRANQRYTDEKHHNHPQPQRDPQGNHPRSALQPALEFNLQTILQKQVYDHPHQRQQQTTNNLTTQEQRPMADAVSRRVLATSQRVDESSEPTTKTIYRGTIPSPSFYYDPSPRNSLSQRHDLPPPRKQSNELRYATDLLSPPALNVPSSAPFTTLPVSTTGTARTRVETVARDLSMLLPPPDKQKQNTGCAECSRALEAAEKIRAALVQSGMLSRPFGCAEHGTGKSLLDNNLLHQPACCGTEPHSDRLRLPYTNPGAYQTTVPQQQQHQQFPFHQQENRYPALPYHNQGTYFQHTERPLAGYNDQLVAGNQAYHNDPDYCRPRMAWVTPPSAFFGHNEHSTHSSGALLQPLEPSRTKLVVATTATSTIADDGEATLRRMMSVASSSGNAWKYAYEQLASFYKDAAKSCDEIDRLESRMLRADDCLFDDTDFDMITRKRVRLEALKQEIVNVFEDLYKDVETLLNPLYVRIKARENQIAEEESENKVFETQDDIMAYLSVKQIRLNEEYIRLVEDEQQRVNQSIARIKTMLAESRRGTTTVDTDPSLVIGLSSVLPPLPEPHTYEHDNYHAYQHQQPQQNPPTVQN